VPNVPDASPGGTESGIKLIFKIVQHETTLVNVFTKWSEAAARSRGTRLN
jgi:hypothetical protein